MEPSLFEVLGKLIVEWVKGQRAASPVEHLLFEHFPDGTSRMVASFRDNRLDIPTAELVTRAAHVYDPAARPSYEARETFLACDYIDMRTLPRRPAPRNDGCAPFSRRTRTFP